MASKLMVVKQTRASVDVPFYVTPAEQKAVIQAAPLPVITGERNVQQGLKKIRTVFFLSEQAYADWLANTTIQESIAARDAYNAANGITTDIRIVDLPGFNPFAFTTAPSA